MPDDALNAPAVDNSKLRLSAAAKARIRRYENPRYSYYDDGGKPGRGNCTWGVGTLAHKGPCSVAELKTKVDTTQVEAVFASRIADAERAVRREVTSRALSQNQFDALVSFVYNVGATGAGNVLSLVDDGDFKGAAEAISRTIYMTVRTRRGAKKVIAHGLIPRRAEESAPFRVPAD
ncbi:glycoside hydrolase family protein [Rugamonas sp. FT107W]|uniref:Lysozyme n=1 Tax=Duganella vulcania TaxID=2692166 RepID=A0A845HN48_9BURK|nr:lysozyme [Duganella vulcania]MYN18863.1 glycoside hydrolase family protein [Duganella vulcania]